jgi:hypothetical protein
MKKHSLFLTVALLISFLFSFIGVSLLSSYQFASREELVTSSVLYSQKSSNCPYGFLNISSSEPISNFSSRIWNILSFYHNQSGSSELFYQYFPTDAGQQKQFSRKNSVMYQGLSFSASILSPENDDSVITNARYCYMPLAFLTTGNEDKRIDEGDMFISKDLADELISGGVSANYQDLVGKDLDIADFGFSLTISAVVWDNGKKLDTAFGKYILCTPLFLLYQIRQYCFSCIVSDQWETNLTFFHGVSKTFETGDDVTYSFYYGPQGIFDERSTNVYSNYSSWAKSGDCFLGSIVGLCLFVSGLLAFAFLSSKRFCDRKCFLACLLFTYFFQYAFGFLLQNILVIWHLFYLTPTSVLTCLLLFLFFFVTVVCFPKKSCRGIILSED